MSVMLCALDALGSSAFSLFVLAFDDGCVTCHSLRSDTE